MPDNSRNLKDATLSANVALPSGAATANTASIDLGSAEPYPVTESFRVLVSTTAATGANSKNINITLQDSADDTTFAAISELGTLTVTETGNAYPAGSMSVQLPPGVGRYLRASATGEANGGNAADGTLTVELLF